MQHIMIAVCIVVIALTLVAIDMKEDIIKRTSLISLGVLLLCIGATIAASNPIIGFLVNIAVIFAIVYQSLDSYKAPMYFPFVLSYIFMLMSSPITYDQLPMRLIGLAIGCVYILFAQLVLNKGRFEKTISGTRKGILFTLKTQINNILDGKYDKALNSQIDQLVNTVIKAVYDSRANKKYITNGNNGILEITLSLEKLNNLLMKFDKSTYLDEKYQIALTKLADTLDLVGQYFDDDTTQKNEIIEKINSYINFFNENKDDEINKEVLIILENISHNLHLTEVKIDNDKWKKFEFIKNSVKKLDTNSFEFKFALKLSISVSIVILISYIFNLKYGRWIVFPMIAIIQPYYDNTITKAKNRIYGTIIGTILFVILFSIVKDPVARVNLTIFGAYIGTFVKKYQYSTAIVAISALGSSAAYGVEILGYRIAFTIIGCAIAMFINKYVLHYRLSDAKIDLNKDYKSIDSKLKSLNKGMKSDTEKYNLILKQKLIEYKIKYQ